MSRERMLAVLYDLALALSSEVRLRPLLSRFIQRLLYHTSFPAGAAFLDLAPDGGETEAELSAAVGDFGLGALVGQRFRLPVPLLRGPTEILRDKRLIARLPLSHQRYRAGLRLPLPTDGVILLLTPELPEGWLPLTEIFQPVMANLAKAVLLCRNSDAYTQFLESDRDQARAELARQLRMADKERYFLRSLYDAMPDSVWLKDEHGVYLACNKAFEGLCGVSKQQIVGKTAEDFVDRATAAAFQAQDREAAVSPEPLSSEEWLSDPNGQRVLVETTKTAVRDAGGRLIGVLGMARNIMERLRATEALRRSEQRLHALFNSMAEGVSLHDPVQDETGVAVDYRLVECNPQFERILNRPKQDTLGKLTRDVYGEVIAPYLKLFDEVVATGQTRRLELFFPALDKHLEISVLSWDKCGFAAVFTDATERYRTRERLRWAANYDALTRLPNRLLLADRLKQAVARAKRSGRMLVVAYLDLDGFKPVNDRFGHEVGDRLLVVVAKRLQCDLRGDDTVARLGGDEFVLLLSDFESLREVEAALKRILSVLAEPYEVVPAQRIAISASIGASVFPADEADPDTLLRYADQAMYLAKQTGRNRYQFFDPDQDRQQRTRREALRVIQTALESGQFRLYYQPKVDMHQGKVIGAEALVRWQHPERGLLLPDEFLPLIESTILDTLLGEWVLGMALKDLEAWRQSGLELAVSVNISAAHLQQPTFIDRLAEQLRAHPGVPSGALELEVVESAALQDIGYASDLILECRQLGVNFALDDFGTGYSSLTYLRRLPAATLKIDQSFVRDMLHDPEDLAIINGVISLAQSFQRRVIAEGVETEEHGLALLKLGCHLAQGYGIARPMAADALADWVAAYRLPSRWAEFASADSMMYCQI
ncbi:MAG TPA: EAL domain-containing protein [Candidatus Competibacter sp.]|nr:EAL domain-containing protein [Candidatus Competibacter sp.]